MNLAASIWDEILAEVQSYRLDATEPLPVVADACRQIAARITQQREAAALDTSGELLSDDDTSWLDSRLEELLGTGPLEGFLRRDDVENIWLFGPELGVLGLSGGRQEQIAEPPFADAEEMIGFIAHLAVTHGQTGRRFDASAPLLDLRLRTGERVFAAMEVCGTPYLTVRCHRHRLIRLDDLAAGGSLSADAAAFLAAAVRPPGPANVLICGALGSGKTTLLRALLGEIAPHEVVCTLEQTFELFLDETHPYTFAAETREPNSDGEGEITMEELARRSLRSGADRVIVGELRGPEAATFLSACGTGSDGSMATIHASSARQALARLVRYCMAAGQAGAQSALIAEAADVIHLVVHMGADPHTGFRGVRQITEVLGAPDDRFETHDIYARRKRTGPLEPVGRPRSPELVERLAEGGVDVTAWPEDA
ncbi:MAG: CpaF family protein [Acidimicrobiales bacterium]|nr:CpaF family protein [Acidimicrobiales bacterium]MYH75929.1 CpaF family protein [Acidimicrobiales bacterium]MYK71429.1 CpaF family protein [Acidimicrobiales bacterium]